MAGPYPQIEPLRSRLDTLVEAVPEEALPDLVGILEVAKARAIRRLCVPPVAVQLAKTDDKLVDAPGMARLLGLPEHWVRDNARRRRIPSLKVGHYVVFDPSEVMAAVRALGAAQDSPSCEARPRKARKNGDLSGRGAAALAAMDTESVQEVGTPVHPSSPAGRGP